MDRDVVIDQIPRYPSLTRPCRTEKEAWELAWKRYLRGNITCMEILLALEILFE